MNPTALITGASRGIGRGIALELAAAGHDLVINFARDHAAAQGSAQTCLDRARSAGHEIRAAIFQADLSHSAARHALIDFTRKTYGRLDLLVNNAGIAPRRRDDILEASEESFDEVLAVNVKAPYFLTQLAARWMIEQVKARPGGPAPRIVTVTSISAYTASVNRGDYCVSKAALAMLTPLFASRLAEFGIQVFEIRPGLITTDMTTPVKERYDAMMEQGFTPLNRWGTPSDVGQAVAAIARGAFPFSTGQILNVDGGFHLRRL